MDRAELAVKEWRKAKQKEYELLGMASVIKAAILFLLLFTVMLFLGFSTIQL